MATHAKLTLEQFLRMPETEPASEYVCGEVVPKPMPDEWHGAIQLYLGALILQFVAATGLGRVRTEWRCIFGPAGREQTWVPDIAYVSHQRYVPPPPGTRRFLRVAPDLAVEIVSPDQNARLFAEKIQFYLRHGVRLVWVIDPQERVITVFDADGDITELRSGDTLDGGQVLPSFSVSVDEIFAQTEQ